jgi:CRP-like cAMP-binding protein
MVFGEMALLCEQPRSANVVADTPVVLHELTTEGLARLNVTQPGLEAKLLRNLAAELSFRLCNLNNTVLELEA